MTTRPKRQAAKRRGRRPLQLFKPPAARRTNPLEPILRRYPVLRAGFNAAKARFGKATGVCGIGIGRKFHEEEARYGVMPTATGGFCIRIHVADKRPSRAIPRAQRIPKWIYVETRTGKRVRVLLDVTGNEEPELQQSSGRSPSLGKIAPGRLFTFSRGPHPDSGTFQPDEANLGTTGALLRLADNRAYATSAGHVFCDTCAREFTAPSGPFAFGASGSQYRQVGASDFNPLTIIARSLLQDCLLFRVPGAFEVEAGWPPEFSRELATTDDIIEAKRATSATGFVWVERAVAGVAQSVRLPIDLFTGLSGHSINANCPGGSVPLQYDFVWQLRLLGELTEGGDSGAPVFLFSAGNPGVVRLLGFHFMRDVDRTYAVDAKSFFDGVLFGKLGVDYKFA